MERTLGVSAFGRPGSPGLRSGPYGTAFGPLTIPDAGFHAVPAEKRALERDMSDRRRGA